MIVTPCPDMTMLNIYALLSFFITHLSIYLSLSTHLPDRDKVVYVLSSHLFLSLRLSPSRVKYLASHNNTTLLDMLIIIVGNILPAALDHDYLHVAGGCHGYWLLYEAHK